MGRVSCWLYLAVRERWNRLAYAIEIIAINKGDLMARIIVTTDASGQHDAPVLSMLDERVCPEHLSDDHSAAQLIERLGWAISDAEDTERAERVLQA